MQRLALFQDPVQKEMGGFQDHDAARVRMRPEQDETPPRLEHALELAEDLRDFFAREVLHDAEVVDAVKARIGEWQLENAAVLNARGFWVVARVKPERAGRNIERGDLHFV